MPNQKFMVIPCIVCGIMMAVFFLLDGVVLYSASTNFTIEVAVTGVENWDVISESTARAIGVFYWLLWALASLLMFRIAIESRERAR